MDIDNDRRAVYTYDNRGKVTKVALTDGAGVTDGYEYAQGSGSGTTTEKPSKVTHVLAYNDGNGDRGKTLPTESFGYDGDGNITTIARSDGAVRYEYDKLGRLTREDNERLGKTWTYVYDAGGNITAKREYAYTKNENPGTVTKENGIVCDPTEKDRLQTYNGKSFAYDDKGLPTTYKGVSLLWYNRRLFEYGSTEFTYDADNVRRTKKVNSKTTKYYYDGSRLLAEKQGNRCVQYLYDHNGLTGFSDGGSPYLYGKNALGDITEIYDLFGSKVASYAYDAWGNCTVYTGSGAIDDDASSIGNTNPFRYRGYYYDAETKLYYLINRYYDPEVGRFISPDHIGYMLMQMGDLNGCNLYAYCLNNPVMRTDPEGTFIITLSVLAKVALALLGVAIVAYIETEFHPIQNTLELIGQGIAFVGTNIENGAQWIGNGIGSLLSDIWKPGTWPGDDPTVPPGDGFEWRGPGEVGSSHGDWYNPSTGDQLHPDLNHKPPKRPHWGWRNKIKRILQDIFKNGGPPSLA